MTINPQMVTLARLSRDLTQKQLASALGVTQATVSKIESGLIEVEADGDQAEALTKALQYPRHFFAQHEFMDGPGLPELYHARKRKTLRAMALSKAYATATIKRIHVQHLLRAWQDMPANFPLYPSDEYGDPEQVARTVRGHFELPPGPIYSMTEVIERAGGIIIECGFETNHIDGFSRWKRPHLPPLFFVNKDLLPDRWRWTVAHELGHVVLHTNQPASEDMESEANRFAEELLTPSRLIKSQLLNPTLSKLAGLKVHWKVSVQALINRAYHLEVISPRQRTYLFTQWTRAGYRLREPSDLDPPEEKPKALADLISFHLRELGFTVADLSYALAMTEEEFRSSYLLSRPNHLKIVI